QVGRVQVMTIEDLLQPSEDPCRGIVRCRERLADVEMPVFLIEEDEIGEGAANVNAHGDRFGAHFRPPAVNGTLNDRRATVATGWQEHNGTRHARPAAIIEAQRRGGMVMLAEVCHHNAASAALPSIPARTWPRISQGGNSGEPRN